MTRDEIINIARNLNWEEMGADLWGATHDGAMSIHALERFAALVAAAERAACAAVCQQRAEKCEHESQKADDAGDHYEFVQLNAIAWQLTVCADAIQARSQL